LCQAQKTRAELSSFMSSCALMVYNHIEMYTQESVSRIRTRIGIDIRFPTLSTAGGNAKCD